MLVEIHVTRLIKAVIRGLHAERRIRLLCARIFLLDVKPKPDHARGLARARIDLAMYREIDARARATSGVIGLRLYVEKENARAQATYAALGMEPAYYSLYQASYVAFDREDG